LYKIAFILQDKLIGLPAHAGIGLRRKPWMWYYTGRLRAAGKPFKKMERLASKRQNFNPYLTFGAPGKVS
jgi:hypothetical protein